MDKELMNKACWLACAVDDYMLPLASQDRPRWAEHRLYEALKDLKSDLIRSGYYRCENDGRLHPTAKE